MNPAALMMNRPCVVHTRTAGGRDEYNDVVPGVEVTTAGLCEIQLSRSGEDETGAVQSSRWNLYMRPGPPLTGWDWVEVEGARYEADGDPWLVRDPLTGEVSHVEATLTRTI